MTQYRSKSKGRKDKEPGLELSIGQVLAAAGATVIGALLAKVLNIWGTVAGTAVLSICSSIGAVLILRAMRSTGERIKSQIAAMAPTARGKVTAATVETTVDETPEGASATAKIPEAAQLHSTQDETVPMEVPDLEPEGHVTDVNSRKKTVLAIAISSVLVFGLTVGTLLLLGVFTGDPGRFIHDDNQATVSDAPDETADPTETTTEDADESASDDPTDSATTDAPSGDATPSESSSPSEETTTPGEDATTESGQGGSEPTTSASPEEEAVSESASTTE
ncbi:hypothetical protein [Glycomyces sp. NPDC047010]|uniref:hypothetical protein n=1 Tax=Glycomyces sp. NPDC047010 TaxID=3155023 RepID=UPI0033FAE095